MACVLLVGVLIAVVLIRTPKAQTNQALTNVSTVDGVQYIDIIAKGGYSPRATIARAGVPTVIRVTTNGTYDCSLGLYIPAVNYRKNLQPTGQEAIQVPAQTSGAVINGVCSMGMYHFSITFN